MDALGGCSLALVKNNRWRQEKLEKWMKKKWEQLILEGVGSVFAGVFSSYVLSG